MIGCGMSRLGVIEKRRGQCGAETLIIRTETALLNGVLMMPVSLFV
jgi:hypothetical protein